MINKKVFLGWLLLMGAMSVSAWAAESVIQFRNGENGYTGTLDTFIERDADRADWNHGGADSLQIRTSADPLQSLSYGIIKFTDIFGCNPGQIPWEMQIQEARLQLFYYDGSGDPARIYAHPIRIDIPNYGTSDDLASAGEVTWAYREYDTVGWGTNNMGQDGPVEDEDWFGSLWSSANVPVEHGQIVTLDITSIVRSWHGDSVYWEGGNGLPNYGLLLRSETPSSLACFRSSEWGIISERPELSISYNPIPGDFNADGCVDVGDLGILAGNYGTESGATWGMGDANGDGKVDVGDLGIVAGNWGYTMDGGGGGFVPEPISLLLLAFGSLGLLRRLR